MHHFTMWLIQKNKKGIVSVNASGEKQNQEINGNHALPLHLSTYIFCDVSFLVPSTTAGKGPNKFKAWSPCSVGPLMRIMVKSEGWKETTTWRVLGQSWAVVGWKIPNKWKLIAGKNESIFMGDSRG